MHRELGLHKHYDLAVIGGGVHGAAVAWEASLAGAKVCLFEQGDFGAGVSANSLKIIHGGLRYLQHLDFSRTRDYAREQERLISWFPHLVQSLPCVMPTYPELRKSRWAMGAGIKLYELLAGTRLLPRGKLLSREQVQQMFSSAWQERMTGGAQWFDAQVYNAERLVLSYVLSARAQGADVLNYIKVRSISERSGALQLDLEDRLDGTDTTVRATRVINAGINSDDLDPGMPVQQYVRAVNLVLTKPFANAAIGLQLPGQTQFRDGRLLFVTPWRQATLVGTWYFADRREAVISRSEFADCLRDMSAALPGESWSEDDLGLVHVGRLPVSGDGRLLDRPQVFSSKRWPRLTHIVGVKYSNARLVAQKLVNRLYGKPQGERKVYGGAYDDWPLYRSDLALRLEPILGAQTVSRVSRNYGSICGQIFPQEGSTAPSRIDESDLFYEEVDHACTREYAYTLNDVLIRRTGLGALMQPSGKVVDHCTRYLADRFNWDAARIQQEREQFTAYYQRVVEN